MKESIRARASALGFDRCGFASATPPEHGRAFLNWLADGCHGGMGYLERTKDRRVDPALLVPDARSVIMLAVSYSRKEFPESSEAGVARGRVARYARHRDYHDVVAGPLAELRAHVDDLGGAGHRSKEFIDTGPVLERDFAHRSGLGFIGKHTNLIGDKLGNWLFLAAILTTLPLEPDRSAKNRCGTCTRCLDACPTRAITAPFRLDARRCISYLTIENRGPIPEEFRVAMGTRIFGCDDCLEACPWNRFAVEGRIMRNAYLADLDSPWLTELLGMDEDAFRRRFRGTPFSRAKRRGLLRNVAVALGNSGDVGALPALRVAAVESDELIAEHARWAIGRIESRTHATPAPGGPGSGMPNSDKKGLVTPIATWSRS